MTAPEGMTALSRFWGRYQQAHQADDDAAMTRMDEVWDRAYDLAAQEAGESEATMPVAEWDELRAKHALVLLEA